MSFTDEQQRELDALTLEACARINDAIENALRQEFSIERYPCPRCNGAAFVRDASIKRRVAYKPCPRKDCQYGYVLLRPEPA